MHPAFPRRSLDVTTTIDVLFAPIVKLERDEGVQQVEAEVDQVRIRLETKQGTELSHSFWRWLLAILCKFCPPNFLIPLPP